MRLALYEPDIPQNTGAILRLAACIGVPVDIIEPCGFALSDKRMKRAGLDYLERVVIHRHSSWKAFLAWRDEQSGNGRLVLMTTKGETPHTKFSFDADDTVMLGRESAGVPAAVAARCDARLRIPMMDGTRSLNIAQAAAMVMGEALRQTDGFPA